MKRHGLLALALLGVAHCGAPTDSGSPVASKSSALESDCVTDLDLGTTFPVDVTGTTVGSHTGWNSTEYSCYSYATPNSEDYAYLWTAPADGSYKFDTTGSNYDVIMYVRKLAAGSCGQQISCGEGYLGTKIATTLAAGDQVIVVIDGYFDRGNYRLQITPGPQCNDGVCDSPLETVSSCEADCHRCGDGLCSRNFGEDATSCPCDCHCGNGATDNFGYPGYLPPDDPRYALYAMCPWNYFSESCDDSNGTSGDGCSSTCQQEYCGDGIPQPSLGEDCDDGWQNGAYAACSSTCKKQFCGDGVVTYNLASPGQGLHEECDDGGTVDGDGCSAACKLELCGNFIVGDYAGEQCDDGNRLNGDSCNSVCKKERCGDGVIQPGGGEQCDDGNLNSGDGCSPDCKLEARNHLGQPVDGPLGPRTALLFPFATNSSGYDSGIAVTNTTADFGTCSLLFFAADGSSLGMGTGTINPYSQFITLVSNANQGVLAGFQGYVIALCTFPFAEGFEFFSDVGTRNKASSFRAQELNVVSGRAPLDNALIPVPFTINGFDAAFVIANTASDALGTVGQAAICDLKRAATGELLYTTEVIKPGRLITQTFGQNLEIADLRGPVTVSCRAVDANGDSTTGSLFMSVTSTLSEASRSTETAFIAPPIPSAEAGSSTWVFMMDGSYFSSFVVVKAEAGTGSCDFEFSGGTRTPPPTAHVNLDADGKAVCGFGVAGCDTTSSNGLPFDGYVTAKCNFSDAQGEALSEVPSEIWSWPAEQVSSNAASNIRVLPFYTGGNGFDTAVFITNTTREDGNCSFTFYNYNTSFFSWPFNQPDVTVPAGQQVSVRASNEAPPWAGLTGSLYVNCDFPAVVVGELTDLAQQNIATSIEASRRGPNARCKETTVNAQPDRCDADVSSIDNGSDDPDHPTETLTEVQSSTGPYPIGDTRVSLTVSDSEGFAARCWATITVLDKTAPSITCPANVTAECNAANAATNVSAEAATGSNLCGATTTSNPPSATYALGTTTVTHTASDGSGNTNSCTNLVTVVDTTPPSVTCPANVTAECNASNAATGVSAGAASASDVCTATTVSDPPSATYALGTTTVTHVANDAAGNSSSCTSQVTVVDTTPPSVTCPANVTAECNASNAATGVSAGAASASDVCTATTVSDPPSAAYALGTTTVTHVANDAAGNSSSCTSQVTVVDTTPPSVTCPANVTAECNAANAAANVSAGAASASDVCTATTVSDPPSATYALGTTTVTHVANDAAGNSSNCTNQVTVVDSAPPSVTCPANVTAECNAANAATGVSAGAASASDVCTATTVSDPPSATYALGTTTVTHVANDAAGNSSNCTNQVTVVDTTPPVFDPASLGTRTIVGRCSSSALAAYPLPTASDVCGGVAVTCAPLHANSFGTNTVICTAADGHGNSTTATLTVIVLEPMHVVFDSPLADDNAADDVLTDADVTNPFNVGLTIPHKVLLLDCAGADVTNSAPVSVMLNVRQGANGSDASVGGGTMTLSWGRYQLNVQTKGFPSPQQFQSLVTVSYTSAPTLVAGAEDARLQSR